MNFGSCYATITFSSYVFSSICHFEMLLALTMLSFCWQRALLVGKLARTILSASCTSETPFPGIGQRSSARITVAIWQPWHQFRSWVLPKVYVLMMLMGVGLGDEDSIPQVALSGNGLTICPVGMVQSSLGSHSTSIVQMVLVKVMLRQIHVLWWLMVMLLLLVKDAIPLTNLSACDIKVESDLPFDLLTGLNLSIVCFA